MPPAWQKDPLAIRVSSCFDGRLEFTGKFFGLNNNIISNSATAQGVDRHRYVYYSLSGSPPEWQKL
jgi:hypothetical protein